MPPRLQSLFLSALFSPGAASAMAPPPFPDPALDQAPASRTGVQTAVLAGGCFWCTEAVFEILEGVKDVVSGYSGGDARTANYRAVSGGSTNHAEAIRITFEASKISYGELLRVFFEVAHDPTQLNRQGPDWGRHYRSAIFYANDEQKRIAESYIAQLNAAKVFPKPIVTELAPLSGFYPAEDYHQDYAGNNPLNPYIMVNANPKVAKLKKACPRLVRKK
jgi:peptide-methionine (S)-S-oxide reductase